MQRSSQVVITNKPASSFYSTARPFLSPNQQCQITEGKFRHRGADFCRTFYIRTSDKTSRGETLYKIQYTPDARRVAHRDKNLDCPSPCVCTFYLRVTKSGMVIHLGERGMFLVIPCHLNSRDGTSRGKILSPQCHTI